MLEQAVVFIFWRLPHMLKVEEREGEMAHARPSMAWRYA
ncbi:hypothetical protein TGS27_1996 [Geobacillus stearothermophilus]|uniref:Uncharacterized protein n=1 Tax=Geobacillus stearothermophilus TaxID=1422 RepID=A0A150MAW8_GEOSE|nr:hypothetical protein GS8_2152 [Geobacillus stearothermophilus]KYD21700.1 hypothetical protein B4109_2025 [Geobacillus stearothermophilus]OAO80167.1 hypothetical protein TGS27_1996 [Geobacillus stearothermophilus]